MNYSLIKIKSDKEHALARLNKTIDDCQYVIKTYCGKYYDIKLKTGERLQISCYLTDREYEAGRLLLILKYGSMLIAYTETIKIDSKLSKHEENIVYRWCKATSL